MHALRQARSLARLVLAWFALSVGIAVAAPIVQPQQLQLLCTGTGAMKLLVQGDDGEAVANTPMLDCPLCATVAPPPVCAAAAPVQPLAAAVQSIPAARIAALTAAPLPARGPPPNA